MQQPNVITITELAREQSCSRQAIYDAITRGDLTAVQMGTYRVVLKDQKYEAYAVKETGGRVRKRILASATRPPSQNKDNGNSPEN